MADVAQRHVFGPYFTAGGALVASPKVYHYQPGTTTAKTAWADRDKNATVLNPVTGDTTGIASFFLDGLYKIVVKDSEDNTLYTWDNFDLHVPLNYLAQVSTWNPDAIAYGQRVTSPAITVTGAELGDFVLVSAPYDLQGLIPHGYVSAADTVEIELLYPTDLLVGETTFNPASLNDGAGETSGSITVTGAALGDFVQVSAPYDLQDITVTAYVQAANTVEIRVQNESTNTINLAEGTWKVRVLRAGTINLASGQWKVRVLKASAFTGQADVTSPNPNAIKSKTANYTVTITDAVVLCDASGGGFTITLHDAADLVGHLVRIKKTDTSMNVVTIDTDGGNIDGVSSKTLTVPYASLEVIAHGGNWHVIA